MQIDLFDVTGPSGLFIVGLPIYEQTLGETEILKRWDLGAVAIIYGIRGGFPIWLMDNPAGKYAIWVEDSLG